MIESYNIKSRFLLILCCITLVLPLVLAPIATYAQEQNEEELIQELAAELEFIFDKAISFDSNMMIESVNTDIIIDHYGYIPEEFNEIIASASSTEESNEIITLAPSPSIEILNLRPERSVHVNNCVSKRLIDQYGPIFSGAAIGVILDLVFRKEWAKAASEVIKIGARGSAIGIATSLSYIFITCVNNPYKYL